MVKILGITITGGDGGVPSDSVAPETTFGVTGSAGGASTYSRGDHTHGSPTNPVPAHASLGTGVHGVGVGTIAKVSDIAVDGNLSIYAQDAVTKRHTANADTDLDPTFEATLEKNANKGAAAGYAPLDSGSKVPAVNLGGAGADATTYLRGDQTWQVPAGGGGDGEVAIVATENTANATVNLANATGLVFAALANSTYIIEGFIVWNANATTVGIKLSATGPSSPTIMAGNFITNAANGTPDSSAFNANDVVITTSASPFTTGNLGMLNCVLKTGVNAGNFQVRFAAETTGTITILAGSVLRYRKVA